MCFHDAPPRHWFKGAPPPRTDTVSGWQCVTVPLCQKRVFTWAATTSFFLIRSGLVAALTDMADGGHSGDDVVMVSRSQLTRTFVEHDERTLELMSILQTALQEAEEGFKNLAAHREENVHTLLRRVAMINGTHTESAIPATSPIEMSSTLRPTIQLESPKGNESQVTSSSGLTSMGSRTSGENHVGSWPMMGHSFSYKSSASSGGRLRRETLRRQYDRMSMLTTNYSSRTSRLTLLNWFGDLICWCHASFQTKRLNCTMVAHFVRSNVFVAWVCFMIFANAALVGVRSDMVMKEAIDAHENQGTVSMNGGAIEVFAWATRDCDRTKCSGNCLA